jgi:hypothetical protein
MKVPFIHRSAWFSGDHVYRYRLGRQWCEGLRLATWIMLNPSKADEQLEDPTIRRCIGFSSSWSYKGLTLLTGIEVVNLFALVSTDPKALLRHPDPIGPENDQAIFDACSESKLVVCAWGSIRYPSMRQRATRICRELTSRGNELHIPPDHEWLPHSPTLPAQRPPSPPLDRMGAHAMTQYETDCEGIRQSINQLQIVKRRIHDDKFVSFSMHTPVEAKSLLGWIEVTLLPNGYLAVTGDYETCVFAQFRGDHWRGAIHWIGLNSSPSQYTLEKARAGMGHDMVMFDKDELVKDLERLVADEEISSLLKDECLDRVAFYDYGGDHALFSVRELLQENDVESESITDLGEAPNHAVVAATAVLHRLDELLDAEEKSSKS